MSYTDAEVQTAIQKLVSTTIRRPYDALGSRQLDLPFADYQQAAAGVFLLNAAAPLYVLSIAALRVTVLLEEEAVLVASLLGAIAALGRLVLPVKDLSSLSNARAALEELEGALYRRSSGLGPLDKVPAYNRFKANVEAFLVQAGSNVKLNGDVVMTPQEARATIPGLMRSLKEAHQVLVAAVKELGDGMVDYGRVSLPSLIATGVVARARELLAGHETELSALTPEERLMNLRQVVLELVTTKSVVKTFGSLSGASSYLTVNGTGMLFSDGTHLVMPAKVISDAVGPFAIYPGRDVIDLFVDVPYPLRPKYAGTSSAITPLGTAGGLVSTSSTDFIQDDVQINDVIYANTGTNAGARWLVTGVSALALAVSSSSVMLSDGAANFSVYRGPTASLLLAGSVVAEVRGVSDEPFNFQTSVNDTLVVSTTDTVQTISATVVVPAGTVNADQAAALINGLLPGGTNLRAAGFFSILKFASYVNTSVVSAHVAHFDFLSGTPASLQINVGDLVYIPGSSTRWTILVVGLTYVEAMNSTASATAALGQYVEMGTGRRLRLFSPNAPSALAVRTQITVVDSTISNAANTLLGFFPGIYGRSLPTKAKDIADQVNAQTTAVFASTSSTAFLTLQAHTDALDPSKLTLFTWQGIGDVTAVTPALGGYLATISVADGSGLNAVHAGDVLVLRSGSALGTVLSVTSVVGSLITASSSVAPGLDVGVVLEVGPSFTAPYGTLLVVPNGPNNGDHYIESTDVIPLDVRLQETLPQVRLNSQPVYMTEVALSHEHVVLSSRNTTTASYVFAREPLALLSTANSLEGFMVTPWFLLPEVPQALTTGDLLELYRGQYNSPTASYLIDDIERSTRVLKVSPLITPELSNYTFAESTPPFARLRAGKVIDFEAFRAALLLWLSADSSAFFTDLNRLISPVLVNTNPTASQVHDAQSKVLVLAARLTVNGAAQLQTQTAPLETILGSYSVSPVPGVDTLLRSLTERGLDRAVDLLLSGQFTAFFGLTANNASYTGDLMQKTSDMARLDLPVSRTDRAQQNNGQLVNSAASEDFEYSTSDTDTGPEATTSTE